MARKQTPIQKLVAFAMGVTEDELNGAMDTLKAIKESRFPKQRQQATRKPRKPRTPTSTPPAANVAEGSLSES